VKVHRIVLTVIDFDGLGDHGVRETLENAHYPNRCIAPNVLSVETRDIGEWRDDHPLNFASKAKAEIERLFGKEKE
jgi:hypothetical protein